MKSVFQEKVFRTVKTIPQGNVATYADIARCAGSRHAVRAVGSMLKRNYNQEIPCHRVVRSDGTIGDYNRGAAAKEQMLLSEGVAVINGKIDLDLYQWNRKQS